MSKLALQGGSNYTYKSHSSDCIYVVYDKKLLCIPDLLTVFGQVFLHKLVHGLRYKCNAFLKILTFEICVQKYDLYRNCRKKWVLYFEFCTKEVCCFVFIT